MKDLMFYVAEDPQQPGAGYAAFVDDPAYASEAEERIAEWTREGAIVRQVDGTKMVAMLQSWKSPASQAVALEAAQRALEAIGPTGWVEKVLLLNEPRDGCVAMYDQETVDKVVAAAMTAERERLAGLMQKQGAWLSNRGAAQLIRTG